MEGAVGDVGEGEEVGGAVDDVVDRGCVDEEGLGGRDVAWFEGGRCWCWDGRCG